MRSDTARFISPGLAPRREAFVRSLDQGHDVGSFLGVVDQFIVEIRPWLLFSRIFEYFVSYASCVFISSDFDINLARQVAYRFLATPHLAFLLTMR